MSKPIVGAVGRMRQFFTDNPGEYLSHSDLCVKFGFASKESAKQAIYQLKIERLVQSDYVVFTDPNRPRT